MSSEEDRFKRPTTKKNKLEPTFIEATCNEIQEKI